MNGSFDVDLMCMLNCAGTNLLKTISLFDVYGGILDRPVLAVVQYRVVLSNWCQPLKGLVHQARQFAGSNIGSSGLTIHVMHNYLERNLSFIYLVKLLGKVY